MDGGSSDNSVQIIQKYEHHLYHWQSRADKGQGPAILEGWKMGDGELVAWLNSDDLLLRGALEQIARASAKSADIIAGQEVLIDEHDQIIAYCPKWTGPRWMYRAALLHPGQPGTFYSRRLAEKVGYFNPELSCAMEFDLVMKMVQAGAVLRFVSEPVSAYRLHSHSKSATLVSRFRQENRDLFRKYAIWPFDNTMIRETAVRLMRYPYALRYLCPHQLANTRYKIRWLIRPTSINAFIPSVVNQL
jgi:glycosyltransferase involved in cell wall biosynthesis